MVFRCGRTGRLRGHVQVGQLYEQGLGVPQSNAGSIPWIAASSSNEMQKQRLRCGHLRR
jgi:hypothetical protein